MRSDCTELCNVEFPKFSGLQVYMIPFVFGYELPNQVKDYEGVINKISSSLPYVFDIMGACLFLTIDEKMVTTGSTHRRAGLHVDESWKKCTDSYIYHWAKRGLGERSNGGMITASTYALCNGFIGDFNGNPGSHGECYHIDKSKMREITLKENTAYFCSPEFIHQSMISKTDTERQFIRITFPNSFNSNMILNKT